MQALRHLGDMKIHDARKVTEVGASFRCLVIVSVPSEVAAGEIQPGVADTAPGPAPTPTAQA